MATGARRRLILANGLCENPDVNWDDLRYLLALSRAGTLAGAARQLKVDHSTVSRRLATLEEALGTELAQRTPDGLVMSSAGRVAAETGEAIDALCAELERRTAGGDARLEGVVRLSTTDSLATFVVRGLAGFCADHPAIRLELVASDAPLDLLRREADVAVRLFRETHGALVARKIGEIGWSVYAAEAYLAKRREGSKGPLDLAAHDVVGYDETVDVPGGRWLNERVPANRFVFRGNSPRGVMSAVAAGIGVSVLPCFLTAGEHELRRLVPEVLMSIEAFVVIPPDHRETARVRAVVDAVVALFERERRLLAGEA
jgi:DNA-binding transcriptional LysR family regulator